MEYRSIRNPVWINAERTLINCEIDFIGLQPEYVLFTASATDVEPHGVEIFNRCVAGDFGPIVDIFVMPCVIDKTEILADGVDEATITGIPMGAMLSILDGSYEITDGVFIITSAVEKDIFVSITATGYEDYREIIHAT